MIGRRLGHYEIVEKLGEGGMGEVYQARDTRLGRTVAIKVLPSHLASRPESRERFEREARIIGGLNHPHICTLYDVGHEDGTDYLVMEHIEGPTLAARLSKGPLPLEQVLEYAIEISDALDKAHRKGITHRDLKPGNILLTKSGAKLLDFGVAKLREEAGRKESPEDERPTAGPLTSEGMILGTLHYMAPEQVEGRIDDIDGRTDIFAFGAVVHEMATGRKAFEGSSQASVIAKILQHDPPPVAPPSLDHLVRTCLAKDPEARWQSAGDLCRQLRWIKESGSKPEKLPAQPSRRVALRIVPWVVAVIGRLAVETNSDAACQSSCDHPTARPAADGPGPAGHRHLARRQEPGLCRYRQQFAAAALPAASRESGGKSHRGDGGRGVAVLFAWRRLGRLLRGRKAEEGFRERRPGGDRRQRGLFRRG